MKSLSWLAALALAACAGAPPAAPPPPPEPPAPEVERITILYTTDVHGAFGSPAGVTPARGARALAALVASLRAEGRPVLLVDSGDMWSGTLLSDENEGALGVSLYNALGYDAVALGNHEFDYGPAGPARAGDDPFEALRARLAEARFPMLAANVLDQTTGALPDWPGLAASTLLRRGDLSIGLVGVVTQDTPKITFPWVGARLSFTDPASAVVREAKLLRERGADIVIVLAHLGGDCRAFDDPHDVSQCLGDSELFDLARHLPAGTVDLLLGGHTHRRVAHVVNDVAVVQPAHGLEEVAIVDMARVAGSERWEIIADLEHLPRPADAADAPTVPADPKVDALLVEAEARTQARRGEVLGPGPVAALTRDYNGGSAVGALVCDALLAQNPDREICLYNGGGLRADIPAGPVTYGTVYDMHPFGNSVAYIDVTGAQLAELVRIGTSGGHGNVQVGGLRVAFDRAKDPCPGVDRDGDGKLTKSDRDRVTAVTDARGRPLSPRRTYRVVTNSFVASGGDGYGVVLSALAPGKSRLLDGDPLVRDQIAAWFRTQHAAIEPPADWSTRMVATGAEPTATCEER